LEHPTIMIHTIETDVLVIGGGAAGVRAAIEAARMGCQATILSSSGIGRANNTAISYGGFSAAVGQDDPERHFEDTMRGGYWLNQPAAVRLLVEQVPSEVTSLEAMGVHFQKDADGNYILAPRGGHSVARRLTTATNSGLALIDPLVKVLNKARVNKLEGLRAVRLLTRSGRISGALAIDRQGEWIAVSAESIVLATGGGGALYPITTNVPAALGEGYALAFEAGLTLRDMEFVQFVAVTLPEPGAPRRLPPVEVFLLRGATLRNARGEDLFTSSGTSTFTRDVITRLVAQESRKNKDQNGWVRLDLTTLAADEKNGVPDMPHLAIRVQTAAHFFMGGITVDNDLKTSIEGLYAAGEVMGGVHGANRLGGNALAEAFVFGGMVGRLAAQSARKSPKVHSFEPALAKQAVEELKTSVWPGHKLGHASAELPELEMDLRSIMGECASPARHLTTLDKGLGRLEALKEAHAGFSCQTSSDWWPWVSLRHQLLVAEMILRSARKREESRGAHFREDFPAMDDECWRVNILVQKNTEGGVGLFINRSTDDEN